MKRSGGAANQPGKMCNPQLTIYSLQQIYLPLVSMVMVVVGNLMMVSSFMMCVNVGVVNVDWTMASPSNTKDAEKGSRIFLDNMSGYKGEIEKTL